MIYGDQWDCGCGWSNLTLRRRCRNCGLPDSLAVGRKDAAEVVSERHASSKAAREGGGRKGEGRARG